MNDTVDRASRLFQTALSQMSAGDDAAAEATLREIDALIPGDPVVLHKFGDLAVRRQDYAAAEDFYRQCHEKVPHERGYQILLGRIRLLRGDYAGGFPLFDAWRDQQQKDVAHDEWPIARWSGEPLEGKRLLVWGEEGFGDQIMYVRFAAELQRRGASIAWGTRAPLVRLFKSSFDFDVVTMDAGEAVPGVVNYMAPSSGLAAVLMPELKVPPPAPYLKTPRPAAPRGARIGVVAKGNPEHRNDAHRSLDDAAAARLMALPGAISLKPEDTGAADFLDTAAIIAGLDLVITVDTSVAHLAGAMGRPVWILLPALGLDWRWQRDRADSPWYPSARLFRQHAPGDWDGVIDVVTAALPSVGLQAK